MVIGAGFGQLPAIKKAKEMGLTVIAIDRNPDAMGMKYADYAYTVDVVDVNEAIKIAKKHKIDGVMTMQTDLPIPTVGAVIDSLNLKGSGLEIAEKCSNKIKTRLAFKEASVPQPHFIVVKNYDEAVKAADRIGYPCIIKSADSSGSRGVTKVKNKNEIENALKEAFKYTQLEDVLVEEYISGKEIGAQGFSINGKCESVLVHNDTLSNPPYMIPIGHSFPIEGFTSEELKRIQRDIKTAVDTLGISDGPTNIDLIVDSKDNTVKIIEIGARIGATCLPELVKYHTGIDWVEAAINIAINETPNLKFKQNKPVAALILQAPKTGIYKAYETSFDKEEFDVIEFEVTAKPGEEVSVLKKGTDRIGKVLCFGETVEQAEKNALRAAKSVTFKID